MVSSDVKSAIKDVLLFIFGALFATVVQNSQNPLLYLLIVPISLILLVLITEITDSPLLKIYNSRLAFKDRKQAEAFWLIIEENVGDMLSDLMQDYKKQFFKHVLLRNLSESKTIVFASYNKDLLKKVFDYVKKLHVYKGVIETESEFSALKKAFHLDKNAWYSIAPESVTLKYFSIKKIYFSLTTGESKSKEIFDILINKIKSIQGFKYKKEKNNHVFYVTDKRYSGAYLSCEMKGSDMTIEDFYQEIEGVESSARYEPLGLVRIESKLKEKLDELIKQIKKDNIEYKIKKDIADAWECKEEDKKIISIRFNQEKNLKKV
jgi:predicted DNA-binding protein (MmcQ/YjbR family)